MKDNFNFFFFDNFDDYYIYISLYNLQKLMIIFEYISAI
jgi:hypothetical protein